jgi:hypothetical protein
MLIVLAGTPYESLAQQWKADPPIAATTNLTCRHCHTPGRLENRIEEINTEGVARRQMTSQRGESVARSTRGASQPVPRAWDGS